MAIRKEDFKAIIKKNKINVNVDLSRDLDGLTSSQQTQLKNIVGEALIEEVRSKSLSGKSPVTNENYDPLDPKYKALKKKLVGSSRANLLLFGTMLGDLKHGNRESSVDLKMTDGLQKKKMFNHNTGDTLKKRQALPNSDGEGFHDSILRKVNRIIKDFKSGIDDA